MKPDTAFRKKLLDELAGLPAGYDSDIDDLVRVEMDIRHLRELSQDTEICEAGTKKYSAVRSALLGQMKYYRQVYDALRKVIEKEAIASGKVPQGKRAERGRRAAQEGAGTKFGDALANVRGLGGDE